MRPAVHVGNVAEFNAQFGPATARDLRAWNRYAALAPFYSPLPAVVVVPERLDTAWLRAQAQPLEWGNVDLVGVPDGDLADAVARLDRAAGRPVVAWGHTPTIAALGGAPAQRLEATRRYESKAAAHAVFMELARGPIVVPTQRHVSLREAECLVARRAARGHTTVLKAVYGVGGRGTTIVTLAAVIAAGGPGRLVRGIVAAEPQLFDAGILVESYVGGGGRVKDVTVDAVIGDDSSVTWAGVGLMRVAGTHYEGVTVGPGVVPERPRDLAQPFARAVGGVLAAAGVRGWFDIDFVAGRGGRLAPTEINVRLTGPAVAWNIKARLDLVRGGDHVVRVLDQIPLGARIAPDALFDQVQAWTRACADLGVVLIPTLPSGGYDEWPSIGVALAARTAAAVDEAESRVRRAARDLSRMFRGAVL